MLIILPFVFIAGFFGRIKGGNMVFWLCKLWSGTCMFLWGIRHSNIYNTAEQHNHPVIFVFNHISYLDIPILLRTFNRQSIRILAKSALAKVPVFGFIYKKITVMVDRESDRARIKSVHDLKKILSKNISVVIAPEGTFNMSDKPLKAFFNGAFKIALETSTPIQPVIFLDAYDRLHYKSIWSMTPGKSRSIFLEEIPPVGTVDELKTKVFNQMEDALINYKASWIK